MAQIQSPMPLSLTKRNEWVRHGILAILLVSIFLFAGFARSYIRTQSQYFQNLVLDQIEQTFNVRIEYRSISPTFWGWFHVNGVEVRGRGIEVEARRLTVHFDALGLLKGRRDISLVTKIDLNGVLADIQQQTNEAVVSEDNEVDKAALNFEESLALLSESVFGFLEKGLNISGFQLEIAVRNVSVTYRAPWGSFEMHNLLFFIEPIRNIYQVELVATPELRVGENFYLALPVTISGQVGQDLLSGDVRFDIINPYQNIINIVEQGLRVQWRDGVLQIRKNIDELPIDYNMRIDAVERAIFMGFSAYQFAPNQFIAVEQDSGGLVGYLDGQGALLYYPQLGLLYYGGNLGIQANYGEHALDFRVDATGTREDVRVRQLRIGYQGDSYLNFTGSVDWQTGFPDGRLDFLWQGANSWSGEVTFDDRQQFMQLGGDGFRYNEQRIGALAGLVFPMSEDFKTFLEFNPADGRQGQFSPVQISALFNVANMAGEVTIDVQNLGLNAFIEAGLLPGFFSTWQLNTQVYAQVSRGDFLVSIRDLELKQDEAHRINISAVVNPSQIELQNLSVFWDNYFAKMRLTSELSATPTFFGEVTSLLTEYRFDGFWDGQKVHLGNEYGALEWVVADAQGTILVEDMPLRSSENAPIFNMNASIALAPYWQVIIPSVTIDGEDLYLQIVNGAISANGGSLGRIRYRDEFADLFGSLQYTQSEGAHQVRINMTSNDLPVNREIHVIDVTYDGEVRGQVSLTRFPLKRLHVPSLEGLLNINVDIQEVIARQHVRFELELLRGFYNDTVVRSQVVGQYTQTGLSLSQLSLQYGDHLLRGGTLLANFDDVRFAFSGEYGQVNRDIQMGFALNFRPTGGQKVGLGEAFSDPWQVDMVFEPFIMNQRVMLSGAQMVLAHEAGRYMIDGRNGLNLSAYFDLPKLQGAASWRSVHGMVLESNFNFNQEDFLIDVEQLVVPLAIFNPFFTRIGKERILGFESGRLEARDIRVINGGVLASGVVSLSSDSAMSLLYIPRDVLNIGGTTINISDNKLQLEPIDIEVGGVGNRSIVQLAASAEIGNPTFSYVAVMNIKPKNPARADRVGVNFDMSVGENIARIRGRASGYVLFDGDTAGARLSGDIYLPSLQGNVGALSLFMSADNARYRRVPTSRNPKPGFLVQAASRDDEQYLPLKITTGNDVTFYIPDSTIPTIQLTAMPQQELVIVLDVQRGAPVGQNQVYIEGDLGIRRGEIKAFGNGFRFREGGVIRFTEDYGFNPLLIFTADLRTDDGHVITMNFEDNALSSSYDFPLSSNTLSETEIMQKLGMTLLPSLVSTNPNAMNESGGIVFGESSKASSMMGEDNEGTGEIDTLKTVLEPIGGIAEQYLSRQLERILRFIPLVDTVTVRTNAVSNLALSRFSASGDSWSDSSSNTKASPWEIFDGTSIAAGFRVTPVFTMEASFGVAKESGQRRFFEDSAQLIPNLGFSTKFDTPIFLVSWTFAPSFAQSSIDQLFTGSVSLSLTKSFYFRSWQDLGQQLSGGSS